jgi:DNA replication and repair protein RecF
MPPVSCRTSRSFTLFYKNGRLLTAASRYLATMLRLQHLTLVQFKNYSNRSFDLSKRVIGICGRNGAGKTNLLDAIYYLCFTRGYFSRLDLVNVQHGKSGFRIEGDFTRQDKPEKAVCVLRETGKKEFLINDNAVERFSTHIGHYPCVIITPDDAQLITGSSEERRKFIDALFSQLDQPYLQKLILYQKILQQRNSCLRSFAEHGRVDEQLLEVLDKQLKENGEYIFEKRKEWLLAFLPAVKHLYGEIAGPGEDVSLYYESELLTASWDELLTVNRQKDIFSQRTQSGIHRDDIIIQLEGYTFRQLASQGQRKSLLFALKIAETDLLQKEKHFPPLLLLDDVFEKLDEERITNLLRRVCVDNEGQVFITDTNRQRLDHSLAALGIDYGIIEI